MSLTTARNIGIIAAGRAGGRADPRRRRHRATSCWRALSLGFLAAIGFLGYRLYMENRFTLWSMSTQHRALLYGGIAAAVATLIAHLAPVGERLRHRDVVRAAGRLGPGGVPRLGRVAALQRLATLRPAHKLDVRVLKRDARQRLPSRAWQGRGHRERRRHGRSERGQASVEFLGVLPAALLVVLAGWQLALAGPGGLARRQRRPRRRPRAGGRRATREAAARSALPSTCGAAWWCGLQAAGCRSASPCRCCWSAGATPLAVRRDAPRWSRSEARATGVRARRASSSARGRGS